MTSAGPGVFARAMRAVSTVEPNEIKPVVLSFMFVFTLMASYYILRPIRDAMASSWTDAELSTLFTMTFVASIAAVALYGAACARIRLGRLVPGVYGFFGLSFFGLYYALEASGDSDTVARIFYVWTSVFSLFHISVFWSFMADIFSRQQAGRVFGFIASGSSIGAIAGPLLAMGLVGAVGGRTLILIAAVVLLIPMGIIVWLEKLKHTDLHNDARSTARDYSQVLGGNPFSGFMLFAKSPYLLGIGVFILLYTVISTFVYFGLKNLMGGLDEALRTQIWAGIDLTVNILTIATAIAATGRIATRFGLAVTLGLIPVMITAGLLLVSLSPMLWAVIGLQVVRRAGNFAITRPGREMLFTAVDRESRFKAKSVIDIVVYRGGDMLTAWAFTALTQVLGLGLGAIALIGAGIAGIWAAVGCLLGRSYDRKNMPARHDCAEERPTMSSSTDECRGKPDS
jgi:ATP:ADP antiporter, AAA family